VRVAWRRLLVGDQHAINKPAILLLVIRIRMPCENAAREISDLCRRAGRANCLGQGIGKGGEDFPAVRIAGDGIELMSAPCSQPISLPLQKERLQAQFLSGGKAAETHKGFAPKNAATRSTKPRGNGRTAK